MHASRTGGTLMAAVLAALAACSEDTTDPASITEFSAVMNGAKERPTAVDTPGEGNATFTLIAGPALEFTLTYTGLRGTPTASHIHLGAPNATGPVVVNLCGGGGPVPWPVACPSTKAATFTDTAAAVHLVGGATMESVLAAMRSLKAYINLHTDTVASGEIRGNIVGVP